MYGFYTILLLLVYTNKGNTQSTLVRLKSNVITNISCPNGIIKLKMESQNISQVCNSYFDAWKSLCDNKTACAIENSCKQHAQLKFCCEEEVVLYDVLMNDPGAAGKSFKCLCNCTLNNRKENITHNKRLTDTSCSCKCEDRNVPYLQINSREMTERLEELKENLTISKNQTNRYRRMKTSMSDHRMSSATIGVFGVIILAVVFGSILIIDIPRLQRLIQTILFLY
ncbi:unnamed protein product [Mytilus coruscus]|uniref:Uncharacterized protein n=1 Tax=Mytilus coruscus TaxID=42192 RepID=A0A6J8BK68_MYTCO|nr:unnamed protein product [Mytilus coruscus]